MKQYLNYVLLVVVLCAGKLPAQTSLNMTLVSHHTYPPSSYNLAGVWSYAAGGREYALVGAYDGLSIVDVTTPTAPVELFHLTHTPAVVSTWHEIKTWDHYAYVTNESGDGLRIVDLQFLPDSVHYKDTILDSISTAHTVTIDEKGYLYLNGGTWPRQGMSIYDLNPDPWNPSYVGEWHDRYIHDQYVRNDTAYVAEISNGLLEIMDVSDRANPVVLGTKDYINSFTHNTWLNDAGNVCFTTDETGAAYIYAWDISDPSDITLLDGIRSGVSAGTGIPHNVQVLNDYLITSYYADGVHITDASRPHNLVEVGYYDTTPSGTGFAGVWGADPFLPSGIVLGTDMFNGLFVFDVDYKRGCFLEGVVTDSTTGLPLNGVSITITSPSVSESSDGTGFYATGVADSGSYAVTYSRFGYITKTVIYTLDNGVVTNGDVELAEAGSVNFTVHVMENDSITAIEGAKVLMEEVSFGDQSDLVTNVAGLASNPTTFYGSYRIVAGIWGRIGQQTTVTIDSTSSDIYFYLDKGYHDDFSVDLGWNALPFPDGQWERGEPIGTSVGVSVWVNPDHDITSDAGVECYVTDNGGGPAELSDVDGGTAVLETPLMNLGSMGKPVLKYYSWFYNGGGGGSALDDTLQVEISNGTYTYTLKKVFSFTHDYWAKDTFDLRAILPAGFINGTMRVRYLCSDFGADHYVEGGLDGFSVTDQTTVGVEDDVVRQHLKMDVAPVPTGDHAFVSYEIPNMQPGILLQFELRDLSGKLLMSREVPAVYSATFGLDMPYPQGVYFASLVMNGETVKVVKVVK